MEASFDKQESMASGAELEKRLGHTPSDRLAAAPGVDLAAISASVESRSTPEAAGIEGGPRFAGDRGDQAATSRSTAFILVPEEEFPGSAVEKDSAAGAAWGQDAARPADEQGDQAAMSRSTAFILIPEKELPVSVGKESATDAAGGENARRFAGDRGDQAAPPRSTALILVPEKGLRALLVEKESARSPARRWVFVAAAVLIVMGPIVGGVSYLLGRRELSALPAPAVPKFEPPPEMTAKAPAAAHTAEAEPALRAVAKQTASAAAPGGETLPAPAPDAPLAGVEVSAEQPAKADPTTPPAPVAQPPALAVAPPPEGAGATQSPAENGLIAAVPPEGAAAEAPVATPAMPANAKKPTADKSDDKSGKQEAQPIRHAKAAKHRPARAAHQGLTNLQHAVASFLGAVRGLLIAR